MAENELTQREKEIELFGIVLEDLEAMSLPRVS